MSIETIIRNHLITLETQEQEMLTEQEERVSFIREQVEAHNRWMAEHRHHLAGLRGGIETLTIILQKTDALEEDIHGDSE